MTKARFESKRYAAGQASVCNKYLRVLRVRPAARAVCNRLYLCADALNGW